MFGYVRPFRPELKCKDFDLYRAAYCGLCGRLRRDYGLLAPAFLSFDFTFLTLLLWGPEEDISPCPGRCPANPLRKKAMCPQESPALELAAAESVILTWWKLRDTVADERGFKALSARLLSGLLGPAYRKAARRCPAFDGTVRKCLEELSALEREGCPSIDRTADAFARLLQAAAPEEDPRQRVFGQILYHLGRWIYLLDARDDLEEDRAGGRYNPVLARYGSNPDDKQLDFTLKLSLDRIGAAFQLGDFGRQTAVLENIIYLGLPLVQRAVFDGSWAQVKKQKMWGNDT